MRAIATNGAVVNLGRFESIITTTRPDGDHVPEADLPETSADGYWIVGISRDGRRTPIAVALTREGISAVWRFVRSGRDGIDFGAVLRTVPAEAAALEELRRSLELGAAADRAGTDG